MSEKHSHEALKGQLEINKMEAAHKSLFVAGWRPAIGWICAVGLLYNTIIANVLGIWMNVPEVDTTLLVPVMMGMLGSRSNEKLREGQSGSAGEVMTQLIDMLKLHEGVRSKVYVCSAGYETIGVGRNISESGLGLSDDEIEYLLSNDIARVKSELADTYFWFNGINEARQDAMIDMCFNLGLTRLRGFVKALEAMSREQFDVAADEFLDSKWAQQVGMRAVRVTEMIRSGEYQ